MDPINQQPDQNIQNALTQIKEWQTQGKKDDAIAGCKEILEVDPTNQEAKNILATLETIETPKSPEKPSHGIITNLIAILLIAAIIGGGIFTYFKIFVDKSDKNSNTSITEQAETEQEEKSEAEIRNDQRLADLQTIEGVVGKYFEENETYPDGATLVALIGDEMPYDPLDGQTDSTGNTFVYSYASYGTEYILAGLFEEETQNTILTTGASVNDHPDYRDNTSENVLFITDTEKPKVKVK